MVDRLRVSGDPVITEDDTTGDVTGDFDTINTERVNNNHHHILSDFGESDINSVIANASDGDHIWWESGTYKPTSPISWAKPITFHWGASFQGDVSDNFGSALDAIGGVVIEQQTAGEDVLKFTGEGKPVFFEGMPILTWESSIKDTDTGHGFNAEPPADGSNFDLGMGGSLIDGVVVDGHDGDHYAFRTINQQLCQVGTILSWGGGVLEVKNDAPAGSTEISGNSVFTQPYGEVNNAGSTASDAAHGIHLSAINEDLNLIDIYRPQVNTDLPAGADNKHLGVTESSAVVDQMSFWGVNMETFQGNASASDPIPSNSNWVPTFVSETSLPKSVIWAKPVQRTEVRGENDIYTQFFDSGGTKRNFVRNSGQDAVIVSPLNDAPGAGAGRLFLDVANRLTVRDDQGNNLVRALVTGGWEVPSGGPNSTGELSFANTRIYENSSGEVVVEDSAGNTTTLS